MDRNRWPLAWALVLACLAAWAPSGCGPKGPAEPAFARPLFQMGGVSRNGLPMLAGIADDTRPVLAAPTPALLSFRQPVEADASGRLALDLGIPLSVRGSERYRVDLTLEGGGRTEHLPPLVVRPTRRGRAPRLEISVAVPASLAQAGALRMTASTTALALDPYSRIESAVREIPPGAWLEFAIGLAEADLGGPPVDFSVSACAGDACEDLFDETLDPSDAAARSWQDRRVDLSRFGGQERRLVFASRAPADALAIPLWANPTVYAPGERRPEDVNLILLSVDTLRADHLPTYGYARDTAPFIDARLARRGTVFDGFVAAAAVTTPSHMTMFTGLQPSANGVTDGLKHLSGAIHTLPEVVRAHGIETAAFTEDGWVGVQQGFGRGFDSFVENKSPDLMEPTGQVDVTFGQARRWLERHRNRRFLLFLHTYQVHAPYAPPQRYADLFAPEPGADATSDALARDAANYDREIRFVDDELRGLIGEIESLGLADRTIFVLVSDHGEEFGEHGLVSHGGHLYREAVRVPLIFEGPGIPAGRRIPTLVAEARLLPTILDLLHVPRPADMTARSLLPLIEGGEEAASEPIFSEGLVPYQKAVDGSTRIFKPPVLSVRLGTRMLVRERTDAGIHYEYYDLAADPGEQHDLYPTRAAEAADLVALIEAYPQESLREYGELTGKKAPAADQQDLQLDPQHQEKLKALGYIE